MTADAPDPPVVLAPDGQPAKAVEGKRLRVTEREALPVVQERLRRETKAGLRGGRVRRGRQV